MSDSFKVDMSSFDEIGRRLDQATAAMREVIDAELQDGCNAIAAEAKQRAPADDGILRNAIGVDKDAEMVYTVFCRVLYAAFVEFGTRVNVEVPPGLEQFAMQYKGLNPPSNLTAKEAIFEWCKHKGIEEQYWYPIFVTIMVKGIKPHPFFFPALQRQLPIMRDRIARVLSSIRI